MREFIQQFFPKPVPTLQGPSECGIGSTVLYTITNFSSFKSYSYSVSEGSVQLVDNMLQVTAPSNTSSTYITLTVSDGVYTVTKQISLLLGTPETPSIISPENNATISTPEFTIQSSLFSGGNSTHQTTDWQIATDENFTNIGFQSLDDSSNLTSITVTLVYVTQQQLQDMITELLEYGLWIYQHKWELQARVKSASSIEEVLAILW